MDPSTTLDLFAAERTRPRVAPAIDLTAPEQAMLCQQMFADGFLLPGGEAEILRLVKPLPMLPAARILVAGAGVAAPARVLATRLGMQSSGYERLPPETLPPAPGGIQVSIVPWTDAGPIPRSTFHHGLALTPLRDAAPEAILATIAEALRPAAHLVLVEYVAASIFDGASPEARAWMDRERRATPPIKLPEIARLLARLGLHIRTTEDIGIAQAQLAGHDWQALLESQQRHPPAAATHEVACWSARARLLRQGQLRLLRWHAVSSFRTAALPG